MNSNTALVPCAAVIPSGPTDCVQPDRPSVERGCRSWWCLYPNVPVILVPYMDVPIPRAHGCAGAVNGANIVAILQQMRGKGMPKYMGGSRLGDLRLADGGPPGGV